MLNQKKKNKNLTSSTLYSQVILSNSVEVRLYKQHSSQHRWALSKCCFMSFLQRPFVQNLLCVVVLGLVPDGLCVVFIVHPLSCDHVFEIPRIVACQGSLSSIISQSLLLAFSYWPLGSPDKNTGVGCHFLRQWTMFCQNSSTMMTVITLRFIMLQAWTLLSEPDLKSSSSSHHLHH